MVSKIKSFEFDQFDFFEKLQTHPPGLSFLALGRKEIENQWMQEIENEWLWIILQKLSYTNPK